MSNEINSDEKIYEKMPKIEKKEVETASNSSKNNDNNKFNNNSNEYKNIKENKIIDLQKQLFPICVVWTPIPCISWFVPSIGHVGICDSEGIIHDFSGTRSVNINEMAFGKPTKYFVLDLNESQIDEYDNSLEQATIDYKKEEYSFCCNNCHSFVAHVLNLFKYKNKSNYNMASIWWQLVIKSKFISFCSFFQTYLGFIILLLIIAGVVCFCIFH